MYSATENNPRDRFKKPVYWFVAFAFLCSLISWQSLPVFWHDAMERAKKEAFFTAKEADEAWRIYDEVSEKAEKMGKIYDPQNFFQDRNILVPLKYKFQKAISYEGESSYPNRNIISLSKMIEGLITCLHDRAEDNFPRYDSLKVSREEELKNLAIWHKAELEAPNPPGCEPIEISGWALLRFCKWVAICYLKFLPFALILIVFQLWRKKQTLWQEIVLRPRFFFFKVLEGPIGVAVYSGVKPAVEWQYAKLSAQYMRQTRRWHLSDEEERALWLQAQEPLMTFEQALEKLKNTPGLTVKRSKMAFAVSYLLVIMVAPVIVVSGVGFQQKPAEEVSVQAVHDEQSKEQRSSQRFLFVDAILPKIEELQMFTKPAARVEQEILPTLVAGKGWFLPPSLAPPLSRR